MKKADLAVQNAKALVGCGYVWGATGQQCTRSVLNSLAKRYPDQPNILGICPKWIGKRVYDCATLVSACLRAAGIKICNGATSQWKGDYWAAKGTIDELPEDKPCILYFNKSGNVMQHTGIYLGGGDVIDARGSREGVIASRIDSRVWTHFAVPMGWDDEVTVIDAMVTATSGSTVRMRRYASDNASVVRKVPVGEKLRITERGSEWHEVMDDSGHSGYMMSKFLAVKTELETQNRTEQLLDAYANTYTVQLLDASEAERDALVRACDRVRVECNVG